MKISYQDGLDPAYTADHPLNFNCIYCGTKLVYEKTNKASRFEFRDFKRKFLAEQIPLLEIEPGEDPPDDYFEIERKQFSYQETQLGRCPLCGWWKLTEEYLVVKDNLWQVFLELNGAIKNFELSDLSIPVEEVRSFLVRKYEDRFQLHPRLLEQVVASVFSDLGYQSICTAYCNDGGIDVVLSGKGEPVAVQVKRYKNKITVEQIRSFLGALTIGGYQRGIYVSTADYQSGCRPLASRYGIELVNGSQFFAALSEAQLISHTDAPTVERPAFSKLYFTGSFPMNSK